MPQGRNQRIAGSVLLIIGGVLSALVIVAQFAIIANIEAVAGLTTSLAATSFIVRVLGGVATLILLAAFVLLAAAKRQFGPPMGFLVLAVVFLVAQLFFQFGSLFVTQDVANLMIPINRVVNYSIIAAILLAAVLVAVRGGVAGFARFSLFIPAVALIVLQFNLGIPYPEFLLPQTAFDLTWVIVGVSYLLAKPRVTAVTVASENLTE